MSELVQDKPPRPARPIILVFLGIIVLSLTFFVGVATGAGLVTTVGWGNPLQAGFNTPDVVSDDGPEQVDFAVFWEVWELLEEDFYYDLPDEQTRVYGAIEGLLNSLGDPYTSFVTPEAAQIMNEDMSGEFEGIGAYVEEAPSGGVYIIRVFEDGPAEQAGVQSGDIVIEVNGEDIRGKILNEAILLIRGPAGSEVNLTILRGEAYDETIEIVVTRARIEIPTVESRVFDEQGVKIGYVMLTEFNASAAERLEKAIQELIDQDVEGIILDLRGNPGGYLDQAVKVADLFLPEGVVALQRDVDGNEEGLRSRDGDIAEDIPLVVLVNQNSASASEIVAGAIKDRGRGVLIGETTFGKGSVQLLETLSDGSMLRITSANWFTPNDILIHDQGISPNIEVHRQDSDDGDVQLLRAIEYLLTGQ